MSSDVDLLTFNVIWPLIGWPSRSLTICLRLKADGRPFCSFVEPMQTNACQRTANTGRALPKWEHAKDSCLIGQRENTPFTLLHMS